MPIALGEPLERGQSVGLGGCKYVSDSVPISFLAWVLFNWVEVVYHFVEFFQVVLLVAFCTADVSVSCKILCFSKVV